MSKTVLMLAATAFMVGCSATPSVTKQRMTFGEANVSGMECRRERPMGTVMPRTICASPLAWAEYDEKQRLESDLLFQYTRSRATSGGFNR